jgi:hypothetical protein
MAIPTSIPKQPDTNQVGLQGITEAIEKFSQKMVDTERQLRTEMENKLEKEIKMRNEMLEETYKKEGLRHDKEIQELKTTIHREMDRERLELVEQRTKLESLAV